MREEVGTEATEPDRKLSFILATRAHGELLETAVGKDTRSLA